MSSIVNWAPINEKILRAANYQARGNDISVAKLAAQHLQSENPDVLFLHFDEVDGAGHHSYYLNSNDQNKPLLLKPVSRFDHLDIRYSKLGFN